MQQIAQDSIRYYQYIRCYTMAMTLETWYCHLVVVGTTLKQMYVILTYMHGNGVITAHVR